MQKKKMIVPVSPFYEGGGLNLKKKKNQIKKKKKKLNFSKLFFLLKIATKFILYFFVFLIFSELQTEISFWFFFCGFLKVF